MLTISASDNKSIDPNEYKEFCFFLEEACGIVLGDNKQYLVNSRLKRLLKDHNLNSLGELVTILKSGRNRQLREHTVDAMTTNETSWFRDSYPFEVMKDYILEEFVKNSIGSLRIWSAACSSGQEPYSISMALQEYMLSRPGALKTYNITATDISSTMLAEAKTGKFDNMSIARGLTEERKNKYFNNDGGMWEIKDFIKSNIMFKELNLMSNFSMLGKFDVIFCRNVLIYFSVKLKEDIINRMAKSLNPGGYLVLGGSESVSSYTTQFETVKYNNGLIYRLKS